MDLCDKNTIKDILKDNKIWAKKKLGQHFLVSQKTLNKIIKTAELSDQDTILEIGPGLGVLTQEMAKQAKLVLGIEKDRAYVEWLRKYFKSKKNVKIICDDILRYGLNDLSQSPELQKDVRSFHGAQASGKRLRPTFCNSGDYKLVSNLPYQITSPVIRKFLSADNKPTEMILMVQKEVAERITAEQGDSRRGFLTVLVEFFADAEIVEYISKDDFWPKPKVESAIIKFRIQNLEFRIKQEEEKSFFALVKAGFSQKRRQIHNPLSASLHLPKDRIDQLLEKALIDKTKRAEDLSLEDWLRLYQALNREI